MDNNALFMEKFISAALWTISRDDVRVPFGHASVSLEFTVGRLSVTSAQAPSLAQVGCGIVIGQSACRLLGSREKQSITQVQEQATARTYVRYDHTKWCNWSEKRCSKREHRTCKAKELKAMHHAIQASSKQKFIMLTWNLTETWLFLAISLVTCLSPGSRLISLLLIFPLIQRFFKKRDPHDWHVCNDG